MSSGYPANREADVVLHDGSTVQLRPVRGEDEAALQEFFAGLSFRSRAFRFFSGAVDLERAAAALAEGLDLDEDDTVWLSRSIWLPNGQHSWLYLIRAYRYQSTSVPEPSSTDPE